MIHNIMTSEYTRARTFLRRDPELSEYQTLMGTLPTPAILCVLPLFHATGAQSVMLPTLYRGGTPVLMYGWDRKEALRLIERERITSVTAVPTMITQLMAAPTLFDYDLSSLLVLNSGGAPAPPAMASRVRGSLNDVLVSQGYRLTECSAAAVTNSGPDYRIHPESCGQPAPVIDVTVVDPAGSELPSGNVGEVWLNGPGVVIGYWERPEATAETFVDGWLRTGDLGYLDEEGFLFIVDRAKDMIIRSGENVYCAKAAVHDHPAVAEVAMIGVPREIYGEEAGAVVRTLPGHLLEGDELRSYPESRIASFKVSSTSASPRTICRASRRQVTEERDRTGARLAVRMKRPGSRNTATSTSGRQKWERERALVDGTETTKRRRTCLVRTRPVNHSRQAR